jgi:hypothetical protein
MNIYDKNSVYSEAVVDCLGGTFVRCDATTSRFG